MNIAKKSFRDRGIEVAGGITLLISEPNRFQTFCYINTDDRKKVKESSEYTSKNFDEFILDDFFFTNYIPDNSSDLYNLPAEALNKIRQVLCSNLTGIITILLLLNRF